jgi:hypothetical protein
VRSPRSSFRSDARALGAAALLLFGTACLKGPTIGEGLTTTAQPTERYGGSYTALPVETSMPRASASGATTGTFVVTVRDDDGALRSGVPIHYRGYATGTAYTGGDGVARITLPAGTYRIDVPAGCSKYVIVQRGTGGSLGLVAGGVVRVPFVVKAIRRYDATNPVTWSPEAPWTTGTTVRFRFSLTDVCVNKLAPRTTFADRRFVPSAEIGSLVAAQRASDANAYVTLTFRCARAGHGHLWFQARDRASERTDLLALRPPPFAPTADWCKPR